MERTTPSTPMSIIQADDEVWQSHAKEDRRKVMNTTTCLVVANTLKSLGRTAGTAARRALKLAYNRDTASIQDSWKPTFKTICQANEDAPFRYSETAPYSRLLGHARGRGRVRGEWKNYLPYDEYRAVAKKVEASGKEDGTRYSSIEQVRDAVQAKYAIRSELFLLLGKKDLRPAPPRTTTTSQIGTMETADEEVFTQDHQGVVARSSSNLRSHLASRPDVSTYPRAQMGLAGEDFVGMAMKFAGAEMKAGCVAQQNEENQEAAEQRAQKQQEAAEQRAQKQQEASERVLQLSLQMHHNFSMNVIDKLQAGGDKALAATKADLQNLERKMDDGFQEQKVLTLTSRKKRPPSPTTPVSQKKMRPVDLQRTFCTTPLSQKIGPVDHLVPKFGQGFSAGAPIGPIGDPSTPPVHPKKRRVSFFDDSSNANCKKPASLVEKEDHVSGASTFEDTHGEDSYFIKRVNYFNNCFNADCSLVQARKLEQLSEICKEAGGLHSLPRTKLVVSRGIKAELLAWILGILEGRASGHLDEGELPLTANHVLVHTNATFESEEEYDPEYDDDNYIFVEEIDETPCDVDGKMSMAEFCDVVCPAMGRFANLSIVLVFGDDETIVQLQVASKKSSASLLTVTEVAKLVPRLMDYGLASCRFVSNKSESYPELPIQDDTIKLLATTDGVHISFENFLINEKPQEHLNTTCNARLTFDGCTIDREGAILMSKPDIPLKFAFKGKHDSCFPDLVHLATALEHGFLESLSMEMQEGAYKLMGEQDEKNLKRFCTAAVQKNHKVAWGDESRTRFGSFAYMPDHERETINMGQFDLNNSGTGGTRLTVASFFDEAEAAVENVTAPPAVKEPSVVENEDHVSGANHAEADVESATALPGVKEPSVVEKEVHVSGANHAEAEVESATAPSAVKEPSVVENEHHVCGASTFEDTHGDDSNAENEPRSSPNVELPKPDGQCHGTMKRKKRQCKRQPMPGKRVCPSHRDQDGKV